MHVNTVQKISSLRIFQQSIMDAGKRERFSDEQPEALVKHSLRIFFTDDYITGSRRESAPLPKTISYCFVSTCAGWISSLVTLQVYISSSRQAHRQSPFSAANSIRFRSMEGGIESV